MTEPPTPSTRTSSRARFRRPADDLRAADLPHSNGDIGAFTNSESPPGVPRWVKELGILGIVLLLAVAAMHLTGHGGGPGMHDMPLHNVMLP